MPITDIRIGVTGIGTTVIGAIVNREDCVTIRRHAVSSAA